MLYLALVVVVISLGVALRSHRGHPTSSVTTTAVQAGGLIAVVRLGAFWGALALYTNHGDWRQTVGYGLLIVNSVVELAIAAAWTGRRPGPPLVVAALIVLTSAALGWVWAWIHWRVATRLQR